MIMILPKRTVLVIIGNWYVKGKFMIITCVTVDWINVGLKSSGMPNILDSYDLLLYSDSDKKDFEINTNILLYCQ